MHFCTPGLGRLGEEKTMSLEQQAGGAPRWSVARMRPVVAAATAIVSLVFAANAFAAFSPTVWVSTDEDSTSITYAQADTDDPLAAVTFYAPISVLATFGQSVGEKIGEATATAIA